MNKRTYILVFLLLLAGFTSELSAQKKPKKAKQEISVVSGQVVDSSGIPVAGALVTAMEGAYFARTDADGAFSVKSGAADYILIEAEGYEPKEVYLPDLAAGQAIALEASPYRSGSADRVELPFGTLTDRRVVGAVNDIDMDRYKDKLSDYGLDGVLQAEGFGVFGAKDVRGMGYTILIDGLVRDGSNSVASLSDMLNADEVERITVLKDAASRLLYGSYADKGIILIKTRRGEAHKRIMNFSYETSFGIPKAQPEYLRAADYMILYNEALRNDGGNPMYSYQDIENARAGVDPVKYPDAVLADTLDLATCYISTRNYGALQDKCRKRAIYLLTAHLQTLKDMIAAGKTQVTVTSGASIDKVSVTLAMPPMNSQTQWWFNISAYGSSLLGLLEIKATPGFYVGGSFQRVL